MTQAGRPSELRRALVMAAAGAPLLAWDRAFAARECRTDATNLMGPAYRPNAPLRAALCDAAEPGTKLRMAGAITDAQTCKALRDAALEVWQVNAAGEYDMASAAYKLRGRVAVDAQGRYAFDSVVPAPYGRRSRHIHYLVSCPGYEPHITQSYFADDELLARDRLVKPPLVVTLRGSAVRRNGVFDIALHREQPAGAAAMAAWPDYAGVYELGPGVTLTVGQANGQLRWRLAPLEQPGDPAEGVLHARSATRYFCAEYDLFATFVRDEHGRVTHLQTNDGPLAPKKI